MAPYDSDSSGGEDNDFTETNVLLGYASSEANGEEISRLGGRPDWLDVGNAPSAALAICKVCKDLMVLLLQLNGELPEQFPGHERRIYVFSCRRKSCRRREGSIRAIRGVKIAPDAPKVVSESSRDNKENKPSKEAPVLPKASSQGLGESLFGVKPAAASAVGTTARVNPFATSSSPATISTNPFVPKPASATTTPVNPFSNPQAVTPPAPEVKTENIAASTTSDDDAAIKDLPKTFAETLTLNNPQTVSEPSSPPDPWPETSEQPAPFPVRWLADAEYETLDSTPLPPPGKFVVETEADAASSNGSGGGKEDKEVFESVMDAAFQKFADRVGQNPDQCLRYEFGGQPLLYSKTDAVGKLLHVSADTGPKVTTAGAGVIPRCTNCGAGRVFEVQLAPHTIEELEIEEDGLDGMDWGTVIVGVCENDCQERGVAAGKAGYVEEWAGVQWEELTVKR
ncbi:programmed cell death protein 2 [Lasiosphaeria miniovina]|uniref:Programmed cell death protein 2 n=1 Tax=Lasiosphaeria miniovina TaxID=1954250 RepID=A0AA40ACJ9_9PEZI|nr:programmed cell death protein 2 [Lasiosphaeria miniovina]KAK0713203.1 programmed cell death protein 2 [Lasiosphaeria miniovina]